MKEVQSQGRQFQPIHSILVRALSEAGTNLTRELIVSKG
jgi:hypothetical protein